MDKEASLAWHDPGIYRTFFFNMKPAFRSALEDKPFVFKVACRVFQF
jgi:hypothetical protein